MGRGAWWATVHAVAKSQLSDFIFTFHFHALEKEMATQSSVLAWRIPGMGEPDGLPSMGLHRVGHDRSDLAAAAAAAAILFTAHCFTAPSLDWCLRQEQDTFDEELNIQGGQMIYTKLKPRPPSFKILKLSLTATHSSILFYSFPCGSDSKESASSGDQG